MAGAGIDGVVFLDHTADVGMDVRAPSLELLFHRAAIGLLALLRGTEDDAGPPGREDVPGEDEVVVALEAEDPARLLADWLREILFLHETRHTDYAGATFDRLEPTGLEARIRTEPAAGAVREIKGVTYHELGVEPTDDGWKARVIFDV